MLYTVGIHTIWHGLIYTIDITPPPLRKGNTGRKERCNSIQQWCGENVYKLWCDFQPRSRLFPCYRERLIRCSVELTVFLSTGRSPPISIICRQNQFHSFEGEENRQRRVRKRTWNSLLQPSSSSSSKKKVVFFLFLFLMLEFSIRGGKKKRNIRIRDDVASHTDTDC